MRSTKSLSWVVFVFVMSTCAVSFIWWFRNRPTYLLYQIRQEEGRADQASIISRYKKLLKKKNLPTTEEIRLRLALGDFYISLQSENSTVYIRSDSDAGYAIDPPFLDEARSQFDRVLELDPNHAGAHFQLGRLLWIHQMETFAQKEFQKSRELDPKDPRPLVALAQIQFERGNPVASLELADQALAIQPTFDEARWISVQALFRLGKGEQALQSFQQCSRDFRNRAAIQGAYALLLAEENYWAEAERQLVKAQAYSNQDGEINLRMGEFRYLQHRYQEALAHFQQARDLYRRSAWPFVWQALTFSALGQCDRSQTLADVLNQSLPRWSWTQLVQAETYLCRGEVDLFQSALSRLTKHVPQFEPGVHRQARTYLDLEKFEELGTFLRPYLDKKFFESMTLAYLAESLYFQNQLELAEETALSAIQGDARNHRAHLWLGMVSARLNKEKSSQHFNRASELNPYDDRLPIYHVWASFPVLSTEQIEHHVQEALRRNPNDGFPLFVRGEYYRMKENWDEAIINYRHALQLSPLYLRSHLGLLEAYFRQNKNKEAEYVLRSALKLNPDHEDVVFWRDKLKKEMNRL